MDKIKKALDLIKNLIGEGKLEEGYVELVRLLESSEEYAELADTARINQADMYTWKAQGLKGTLSGDESRRTASQLADNALKIVRQLETGKVYFEPEVKPHSSKAWRYYLTGGIGALVLATATYFFLNKETEDCPVFEDNFETRVMILPFLNAKNDNPEIDIMESLNEWIEQTPRLRNTAISAVHNGYNIENQYPNSAQAVEVAQNCDAQMLVWGKVRALANNGYTLDVRYRLVNDGGVLAAGDTSINRLLSVTEEASLTSDAEAIGRMLYIALANYKRTPIAANLMAEMTKSAALVGVEGDSSAHAEVDTSSSFILADQYYLQSQPEKAIAEYDKVLEQYPENSTALIKRGALFYQKGEFSTASRNFEAAAAPLPASAPALREASYKAYMKSGQPAMAEHVLETAQQTDQLDSSVVATRRKQVQDSISVLRRSSKKWENEPKTKTSLLNAASANLRSGNAEKAETLAKEVVKLNPKNTAALQILVDAHLQQGDTAKAVQTVQRAQKAGADIKALRLSRVKLPTLGGGQ